MLYDRIKTAVWLAASLIALIYFLPAPGLYVLIVGVFSACAWEWAGLADLHKTSGRAFFVLATAIVGLLLASALGFPGNIEYFAFESLLWLSLVAWVLMILPVTGYPGRYRIWKSAWVRGGIGMFSLILAALSFAFFRQSEHWFGLIIYAIALVVCADTGAYFSGKRWGKHKLMPNVSPGKTWEGFIGGLIANVTLALVVGLVFAIPLPSLLLFTLLATIMSVLGDLVESMFKRHAGIKDSGTILPGHGGLLDRVDSALAASPIIALGFIWMG